MNLYPLVISGVLILFIANMPSATKAVTAEKTKVTEGPNLSQSIPATKLDGKVIIPVNVATVPRAVALYDGLAISDMYDF